MCRLAFVALVAAIPRTLAGVSTWYEWLLLHIDDGACFDDVPNRR